MKSTKNREILGGIIFITTIFLEIVWMKLRGIRASWPMNPVSR